MRSALQLVPAAVLFVSASSAAADKFADCSSAKAEVRIRACSEVIEAPTFRGRAIPQSDLAIAYSNRGTALIAKGDYERAIADFDAAIRLNPKNTNAYFHRGVAYDEKGSPDLAIPQYDKTIELKPDHGYAYCRRAAARGAQAGLTSNTASKKRWLLERSRADWRSAEAKITRQDKWQRAVKAKLARSERLLASSGTPPEPKPARPVSTNWSDRTVCILALDTGKSRLGAGEKLEVQEFSRRGFTVAECRATLGLPKIETSDTAGGLRTINSNWSDRTVCILALDAEKLRVSAGESPEVQEFSRRDLSVEKCRSTLGLPKTETSATAELRTVNNNWSDRTVCILALDAEKLRVAADEGPEMQEFSRRGLSVEKCRLTLGLREASASMCIPTLAADELRTAARWLPQSQKPSQRADTGKQAEQAEAPPRDREVRKRSRNTMAVKRARD
jgi:hypothetical protein